MRTASCWYNRAWEGIVYWKYKILRSLLGPIFSRTPVTEQSLPRDDVT